MLEDLENIQSWLPELVWLAVLVAAAGVSFVVIRPALLAIVNRLTRHTESQWDDAFRRHKVFGRVAHVIPALVVYLGIGIGNLPSIDLPEQVVNVVRNVSLAYVALMLTLAISAALSAGNEIYETYPISRNRPLKGIVQLLQIVVFILGAVFIIANLIDRSPVILLSGFGALTAVLLLVFKDTILGLVASLQLTAHDMVRVGDWVEMPAYGADGDVIEVALHTVKIQNFDKTITTIPTYKLIAESFKNWRGMSDSGGRRIKRSINIDQSSIRFLTGEEIETLSSFALLREHFQAKRKELEEAAESLGEAAEFAGNRRRLTNVGVFRAYVVNYLRTHPDLHRDMTLLVRQLEPGPDGLPIQIYCFTKTTEWLAYEDVQSDIFDHILAILPEFGLRLFQKPTGADLAEFAKRAA
jgi:miniconductance mechanosensitive channel